MQTTLAILLSLAFGWLSLPERLSPQTANSSTSILPATTTQVILLGTGTPYPDPATSGPATAVVVGGRVLLFDAGPGVMRRLQAANLPISGPEALFITHLHSDHTLGYADLILTSWVMRRRAPFPVYGPGGLQRMTRHLLAAYSEDIDIRENGLEHEVAGGYRVDVHEIRAGVVYEKDGVRVTAIAVQHGAWREAFAYRIDTPDRSIVISGDTRPSEALAKAASGVDILIHEVYSAAHLKSEDRPGGNDWPRYCREYHTSDVELGALAVRIRPRLLILDHIIRMGASDEELLAGIRSGGYQEKVFIGRDLDRY
jgi:ribonuclease BN (tRNA processing enzyme)